MLREKNKTELLNSIKQVLACYDEQIVFIIGTKQTLARIPNLPWYMKQLEIPDGWNYDGIYNDKLYLMRKKDMNPFGLLEEKK